MKTNIIILALIVISMGWCATGCEQTTTQVPPQDTWVEITNTTHLPSIFWLSAVYSTWKGFTGLEIRDTIGYNSFSILIDTSDYDYKRRDTNKYPITLPPTPDFSKYSMVGLRTLTGPVKYHRNFYVNDALQQYRYVVYLESTGDTKELEQSQNWLLVPRLKQGYIVIFDTTTVHPGR